MCRLRRLLVLGVFALVALPAAASANHGAADNAKDMLHLGNSANAGTTNSDLAFWGNLAYAGNYNGFRIIDVSNPSQPVVLSDVKCRGPQGDVGVWRAGGRTLLFLSVDRRQLPVTGECGSDDPTRAIGWEGIRIFDVSNPRSPRFVKAVDTDCGSHTHTVVPDPKKNRVLVYVSSYPLTEHGADGEDQCVVPHNKISVVEVPLRTPENARVISEPPVPGTAVGCHDIGVFLELKIAAAACLTEGQIWDISDPVNPRITDRILNPAIEIWHSASFSWDGRIVIFGDEEGGAAATAGCTPPGPPGAMWFYRRANPPVLLGSFEIPRPQLPPPESDTICTTHNYNVVPLKDRYIAVSAYYEGGTSVIDFTNPASAQEIAYFDAQGVDNNAEAFTWSSYWYNGYVYANDIDRGVDIFGLTGAPATAVGKAGTLDHLNPQTQERRLSGG